MRARVLEFIGRPNSRNVFINTVGNYLNIGFTALFALVLVRIMTPAQYGVLSVLLGIAYVLANVLDFGTTATIYSTLPTLLEGGRERLYRFMKTTFAIQSAGSLIIILALVVGFPALDQAFFKTGAPRQELYITAICVLFLIWQNFALNLLFAAKKFLIANIYNNVQNLVKTGILFYLIVNNSVTVGAVIFLFGVVGPVVFFMLLFFEKKSFIWQFLRTKIDKKEFEFGYAFTFFFAMQLYNLGGRMDLFLLSYYGLKNSVGYYGLAQKVMLSIVSTVVSVTQVLAPNFARVTTKKEARHELFTGFLYLLIPTALFVLLYLTPNQLFYLFFTAKFGPTTLIVKSLVPAFIVFTLGSLPLQFVLYTARAPRYVLYGNLAYFLLMSAGSYYLIPMLGTGALPIVNLIAIAAPVCILTYATVHEYRKLPS